MRPLVQNGLQTTLQENIHIRGRGIDKARRIPHNIQLLRWIDNGIELRRYVESVSASASGGYHRLLVNGC